MNIGIIGCGAIANFLLEEISQVKDSSFNISSILVRSKDKYERIAKKYGVSLHTNVEKFLQEPIDLVVEAATVEAVQQSLPKILPKKDVIVISIGAFVDKQFLQKMISLAKAKDRTIYLPSGAIGGLDLLQHANTLGELEEVTLTTRKPAHTLIEETITEERIIFSGTAAEAIKKFPKNINVAIVLSLATLGIDQTKVKIIADPEATKNEHHIEATGVFGSMDLTVENEPLPSNPKTSFLAALSVLNTLKSLHTAIKIC